MKRHVISRAGGRLVLAVVVFFMAGCGGRDEKQAAPTETEAVVSNPGSETANANEASQVSASKTSGSQDTTTTGPGELPTAKAKATIKEVAQEPTGPASVRQAKAVLDLSKFPQMQQATDAYAEVGLLRYESPADVASAVTFHVKHLAQRSWEEDTEGTSRHVDEQSAYLAFEHEEGYFLILSVQRLPDKEGWVQIMLRNQGNVDTSRLPRFPDAEVLLGGQATTVYVTSAKVAEVVEFTQSELSVLGWQQYKPPIALTASDTDNVSLFFKQNGISLAVYLGVSPDQDGKTSVQYDTSVLNNELPAPPDATAIEYDDLLPYLKFQTSLDFDKVAAFYRKSAEGLGWTAKDELTDAREDSTTLFFEGDDNTLYLLQLTKAEGDKTQVTFEGVITQKESSSEKPPSGDDQNASPESSTLSEESRAR